MLRTLKAVIALGLTLSVVLCMAGCSKKATDESNGGTTQNKAGTAPPGGSAMGRPAQPATD